MSNPTSIRIVLQDGTLLVSRALSMPAGGEASAWVYLVGGLGVHVFADGCVRISNGVANGNGSGGVFFDRIELDYDAPPQIIERANWRVNGNTLTLGNGGEFFPVRASIRVRMLPTYDRLKRYSTETIGGVSVPFPAAMRGLDDFRLPKMLARLKDGQIDAYGGGGDLWTGPLGMWRPLGNPIPNDGGAWGIELALSGWNMNSTLDLLRHDLTMERQPTDCLDSATGEPLPFATWLVDGYYGLSGGYGNRSGQLKPFCKRAHPENIYDESCVPLVYNTGASAWQTVMSGFYWSGGPGYVRHDDQHLCRAYRHARASANLWGDLCAAFDLKMIAQDCRYHFTSLPAVQAGQGSELAGTRGWAECGSAMGWHDFVALGATAQTSLGQIMRVPSMHWSQFIPNCGLAQLHDGVMFPPMSMQHDSGQTYELAVSAVVLAEQGFWNEAEKAMSPIFEDRTITVGNRTVTIRSLVKQNHGDVPKFVGVGDLGGSPHRAFIDWCFWGDFVSKWVGLGIVACKDPQRWCPHMLGLNTPTGGVATTFAELKHKLVSNSQGYHDSSGYSVAVMAMAALEKGGF